MNVLLLIPDGVGVRNFVLGPFLETAAEDCNLDVMHIIPDELMDNYRHVELARSVRWTRIDKFRDSPLSFTLRNSLSYSQTYWINNFAMRMMRSRPINGSWKTRAAVWTAKSIGYAAASPRGIQTLEKLHTLTAGRLPDVAKFRKQLQERQIDVLFCSHQRPPAIIQPVLAARSLGIPTATFIFSWDNLSSKGRIAAPFDHYLLWSEHMRDEMRRFYPQVSPERLHVVGTPQFDPYADDSRLWSREEFCRRVGADPARPLICFSGGDVGNSLEDHLHIRALLELIRDGKIRNRPQVILRPAPVDDGARYAPVRRDHPELIYAQPAWIGAEQGEWSAVFPLEEDVTFLANLTYHCDLNVNFASTMTLDFALRDKPVINLAFDVSASPVFGMPMWDYYQQWEHYRPVIELGAARFARSRSELAELVNTYLARPELDRQGRQDFVNLEVGAPVGEASGRIVEVLKSIAGRPARSDMKLASAS